MPYKEQIDKELDIIEQRQSDDQITQSMYDDPDFCLEQLSPDMLKDAVALLKVTVLTMAKYGHEISYSDLLDTQ